MALRFMDNRKNNKYYAQKAIEQTDAIDKYISNKNYDEFVSDEELIDAVMFRLIQMVENIKNISSDFKARHPEIPWGDIAGFRNGIVHDYGKTDYLTVYETITNDIDELKEVLKTI